MTRIPLLTALFLLLVAAPAGATSSIVDVPLEGPQTLRVLDRLGVDVTEDVTRERARVALHDDADRQVLVDNGFVFRTVVPDVDAALRTVVSRQGRRSALPTARDTYRVLADYYEELDALAQEHPGLVRRVVLGKQSVEGRDIVGVEIASNVNRTDDGRPVAVYFGLHHAREWPSGEVNMEFATELARKYGSDPRITAILDRVRVFVFPVVNPDGFVVSRGESPAAPGGDDPLHRKNCRPSTPEEAEKPCVDRSTVDLNRNYGAGWGGIGASTSKTSDSYRGTGPFSEPESQAVHEFSQRQQIMHVQSTHNIVGQVLRQPGFQDYGPVSPDEGIMKPLGDKMGAATDYDSLLGYELYDVHGATEDWNYIAQGAMGYTIELGPPDTPRGSPVGGGTAPLFFGPYQTHVVDQYLGGPSGGPAGQGVREAFLLAAEQAGNAADHSVLEGRALPGHILRVRKEFNTATAARCPDTGACNEDTMLPPLEFDDFLETTLTVPESGRFEWHVGPSTRPWEKAAGKTEAWVTTCETPGGEVLTRREVVVDRGQRVTFGGACEENTPVTVSQQQPPADRPVVLPPRSMRLFVGPQRIRRSTLRRRGYLRVAMKVSGATVTGLRLRLVDRERVVVAAKTLRRVNGPRRARLTFRRVPPRGLYRLSLRGTADNGAPVGTEVTFRILRGSRR